MDKGPRGVSRAKAHVDELLRALDIEYALMPEAVGGLSSLYLGTEDYTCLVAKSMGKRDKGPQGRYGGD